MRDFLYLGRGLVLPLSDSVYVCFFVYDIIFTLFFLFLFFLFFLFWKIFFDRLPSLPHSPKLEKIKGGDGKGEDKGGKKKYSDL